MSSPELGQEVPDDEHDYSSKAAESVMYFTAIMIIFSPRSSHLKIRDQLGVPG
jgi:hypothetical protein